MIDIEKQKEHFKAHKASFSDYGKIKILDFKNPSSSEYRIRFIFEEDYCKLHISGDLGELIATNYNNMTFEKFLDFVNDPGYFEQKIDCLNRTIYIFDEDKAREQLRVMANKNAWLSSSTDYDWEDDEEQRLDYILDDILDDFSEENGIGRAGYDKLSEFENDAFDFVSNMGKEETGILDLYMLAFKMALEQLKEN